MKFDREDKQLNHFFSKLKQEDEAITPSFTSLLNSLQEQTNRNLFIFSKRFALAAILVLAIFSSLFLLNENKSPKERIISQWRSPTNSLLKSSQEWRWQSFKQPEVELSNWTSPTASLAKQRSMSRFKSLPGLNRSRNNSNRTL